MRLTSRLLPALVSLPALALAAPSSTAPAEIDIDFSGLATSFQEKHCPEGSDSCDLEEALAASFARIRLGNFVVHFPATHVGDKDHVENLQKALLALADLQVKWVEWLTLNTNSADLDEAERTSEGLDVYLDLATVKKWVEDWKPKDLADVAAPTLDLYEALGAPQEVRDAEARLAESMHDEELLGLVIPDEDEFVQIMICPDRLSFMEAVGFAGSKSDEERDQYWHDGVHEWTQIWVGWTFALALEYAPWGGFDKSFKGKLDMDKFEKTGLAEHVIQRSTMALFRYCRPGYDPGHLGSAISLAMAIEICGQVKTIDGVGARSSSGAQTLAYERFVPGGNPQGGVLPAIPAAPLNMMTENHWRSGGGKDYFKSPLKKGQKAGAKRIKKQDRDHPLVGDKTAHFLLEGYEKGGKFVISAPFFGEVANEKDFPDSDYMIDYREFFRSYKTAFFNWLRFNGVDGSEAESQAKFRELMRRYIEVDDEVPLQELVMEIYSAPLSAKTPESGSLEWRFLDWLSK